MILRRWGIQLFGTSSELVRVKLPSQKQYKSGVLSVRLNVSSREDGYSLSRKHF